MATSAPAETTHPAAGAESQPAPKKKFDLNSKNVKILALLLVVMGAQTAVVYLILPSPSDGGHDAAVEHEGDGHGDAHGSGHGGHGGSHGDTEEVEIADFSSTVSTNGGGTIFFVTFKLSATVAKSIREEFVTLVTLSHKARVNEAVVKVIRKSSMEDLNDAELDVFRRNLRSEINNILPQRYLDEVIISEFRTMEQ